MTNKAQRSMGKSELLILLGERDARIESLEKTVSDIRNRNAELQSQINDLQSQKAESAVSFGAFENAGSIAEASIQVSNVFLAAQNSADKYLEGIRNMESNARDESERIIRLAQEDANALIVSANRECAEREEREKTYIDSLWSEMQEKLMQFYNQYSELGELFTKTKFQIRPDSPSQTADVTE